MQTPIKRVFVSFLLLTLMVFAIDRLFLEYLPDNNMVLHVGEVATLFVKDCKSDYTILQKQMLWGNTVHIKMRENNGGWGFYM